MSLARSIEGEWLDSLSADDPRAMRSRRDLRRVNAIMLQAGIMARLLNKQHVGGRPQKMIELGGGDGTFILRVAHKLRWRDIELVLVDRQDIVGERTRAGFAELGWRLSVRQTDVFDFLGRDGATADVVAVNLFLHHFSDADLARFLRMASTLAPSFVACEPRRSAFALLGSRMVFALGCNAVSRHDAVASVRAGFEGDALSRLWPQSPGWRLYEQAAWPFTHCFAAWRG